MEERTPWLGIFVAAAVVVAGTVSLTSPAAAQPPSKRFTPFTASIHFKHFAGGMRLAVMTGSETFARKRDGSDIKIWDSVSPSGKPGRLTTITDVAAGEKIVLESFTKSKMTFHQTPEQLRGHLRAESCPEAIALRTDREMLLGQEVYRIHRSRQVRGATENDTKWVAPKLGCFVLKRTRTVSYGGGSTSETVTSLILGDPAEALFVIPAGYVERSPSQLASRWLQLFPGHPWDTSAHLKLLDRAYYAGRRGVEP